MANLLILNGPNLSRLGSREPDIYGQASYDDLKKSCEEAAREFGFEAEVLQTDDESELIHWLHRAVDEKLAVVLNPAAFTHYSYAVADAAVQVTKAGLTLIEVHLSNPHTREEFRHKSVISSVATGVIAGFGLDSYRLAIQEFARLSGKLN